MSKILLIIILAVMLSLVSGIVFGFIGNNYEINKCKKITTNQYYEAQSNCYMPLNLPQWNLFWNVVGFFIISLVNSFVLGIIIFMINELRSNW